MMMTFYYMRAQKGGLVEFQCILHRIKNCLLFQFQAKNCELESKMVKISNFQGSRFNSW